MEMRTVVPWPIFESMPIVPPNSATLVLTTSMPTPRPEMLEISSRVLKPGAKISS